MIELGKIAYIEPDAISLLAVVDSERMLESVSLIKAKKTRQAQKGEEKPRRPLLLMHQLPLNLLLSLTEKM